MKKKLIFLIFTLLTSYSFSHEYILIAHNFFVNQGEKLELHLFVADGFNIELERPFQEKITNKFELINENGKKDLSTKTKDGNIPIIEIDVDFKGLGLIHMERDYARITMSNEKFKDYLQGDNIENIVIDENKKLEQTERYTRYIKALVQSNIKTNDSVHKVIVGHNLEIVLLDDPYKKRIGDWINAQIFFLGKPLENKVITARNRLGNQAASFQYSRTNQEGICSFKIERAGDWFIHLTHMIKSRDINDSDWESFWATYSFGIKNNLEK